LIKFGIETSLLEKKIDLNKIPSPDRFPELNEEEQQAVLALDSINEFQKGHLLITEGQYFSESYYVVTGCVRQYKIEDGEEFTLQFYTEGQSISSYGASNKPVASKFYLQCIEASRISVVSFDKELEMYRRFPRFEKMCRIETEKNLIKHQEDFATFISSSPEERYLNLIENRPGLIERVPQYHLASYLGVKPESLSRIRRRLAKK